jgi:hypothetical protein
MRADPPRDYVITGIPRSGTSLLCRLLDDQENSVAINEPSEAITGVGVRRYPAFLLELYARTRAEILSGRPIRNKVTGGRVRTDTRGGANRSELYQPLVQSPEFLLGTKDTLQYLSRLDTFRRALKGMPVLVCIRDPVNTIASWTRSFEHLANADVSALLALKALGSPRRSDAPTLAAMRTCSDVRERRALLWRYLATIVARNRDWISVIKYEDLTTDTSGLLSTIVGMLDPTRASQNVVLDVDIRVSRPPATAASEESDLIWDVCGDIAAQFDYSPATG